MERSIEASTTIGVAFALARQVLLDGPGAVFGEAHRIEQYQARRFRFDLSVGLGSGASVHQDVALQLGTPRSTAAGLALPVAWKATGRERLLPAFQGDLQISETSAGTSLRLQGSYTVPLGVVGRFGDRVVGHRLARRSLDSLVQRLAAGLESEVEVRLESVGRPWEPRTVEVSEQEHSEIYVG